MSGMVVAFSSCLKDTAERWPFDYLDAEFRALTKRSKEARNPAKNECQREQDNRENALILVDPPDWL